MASIILISSFSPVKCQLTELCIKIYSWAGNTHPALKILDLHPKRGLMPTIFQLSRFEVARFHARCVSARKTSASQAARAGNKLAAILSEFLAISRISTVGDYWAFKKHNCAAERGAYLVRCVCLIKQERIIFTTRRAPRCRCDKKKRAAVRPAASTGEQNTSREHVSQLCFKILPIVAAGYSMN